MFTHSIASVKRVWMRKGRVFVRADLRHVRRHDLGRRICALGRPRAVSACAPGPAAGSRRRPASRPSGSPASANSCTSASDRPAPPRNPIWPSGRAASALARRSCICGVTVTPGGIFAWSSSETAAPTAARVRETSSRLSRMTSVVWRISRNTGMKTKPQLFLQIQAMQPHEAGAKPEHVGDEERRALAERRAGAGAARSRSPRSERRRECPNRANGAAQTEGWAFTSPEFLSVRDDDGRIQLSRLHCRAGLPNERRRGRTAPPSVRDFRDRASGPDTCRA